MNLAIYVFYKSYISIKNFVLEKMLEFDKIFTKIHKNYKIFKEYLMYTDIVYIKYVKYYKM